MSNCFEHKYDSLIFDLDGTLWNACETIAKAWSEVSVENRLRRGLISKEDVEGICGLSTDIVFDRIFGKENSSILHSQCVDKQMLYVEKFGGQIYDGVLNLIPKLAERYRLYIVSNCDSGYIESFLQFSHLKAYFDNWKCYGDFQCGKTENIVQLVTEEWLQNPLYIGDTEGDYLSAYAAAVPFHYMTYGFGYFDYIDSSHSFAEFYIKAINY